MELKEYQERLLEINKRFNQEKTALAQEYAFANNPYQIGSIFTDHMGSILIERVEVNISHNTSACAYYGLELKKDGTPTKKGKQRWGWQMNDINKNKTVSQ